MLLHPNSWRNDSQAINHLTGDLQPTSHPGQEKDYSIISFRADTGSLPSYSGPFSHQFQQTACLASDLLAIFCLSSIAIIASILLTAHFSSPTVWLFSQNHWCSILVWQLILLSIFSPFLVFVQAKRFFLWCRLFAPSTQLL